MSCNIHITWDMPMNAAQVTVTITEQPSPVGMQMSAAPVPFAPSMQGPGTYTLNGQNYIDVTVNEGVGVRIEIKAQSAYGDGPTVTLDITTPRRNDYVPGPVSNAQASLVAWV